MQVVRDEVNITTVRGAFMADPQTGYVKLGEFTETSDREMGAALEHLTENGMKRLILDLRDNPGGALDQAIAISNRFLPRGDMIVYTRGRVQNSDQDYRATESSDYLRIPMVTLVDRRSASASEIVSGALQDHDRSLIVGETTFGKALVQSVYRVNQNAGAAITTARYYTPSGRLIQRPWDGTFDEYLTYTLREQDASRAHKPEELKYTDSGRKVYSGGGIEPDRRIDGPVLGFNPSKFGRALYARNVFDTFSQRFSREGDTRIVQSASTRPRNLSPGFEVSDAMMAEFREHVTKTGVVIDEPAWQQELPFIKAMIRYEIDLDLFGLATASENLAKADPQLQFALSTFGEAEELLRLRSTSPSTRRAAR
jgi:carboxyl-terminal processing protease